MNYFSENLQVRELKQFCPLHINPEVEIVFVYEGFATVQYDNEKYEVFANQAILILPYRMHSFIPSSDAVCDVLMFSKSVNGPFVNKYRSAGERKVFCIDNATAEYIKPLIKEYIQKPNEFIAQAVFYALVNLHIKDNRFASNKMPYTDVLSQALEYICEHPEAALSPMRLLTLMAEINDLVKKNSQFIIATHSPILMAFPNAQILEFSQNGIKEVNYQDAEHFKVTKRFLENPEKMLHYLLNGDDL